MGLEVNGKSVMEVREVKTETQTAIVKEFYCYYYKTKLVYDSVAKKVKATIYNYLDEVQTDFNEDIIFSFEGNIVTVTPSLGVSEIDFNINVAGVHIVKTVNEIIENGEVNIHVE
ncbi:MAG: hypothetical protein F8N39_03050 [Clostridiaceae bacterium]|nr:hypothetical protein [Clostridiaceae bacterium]